MQMRELPKEFVGTGEVKDWQFTLVKQTELGYCYRREWMGAVYYEVFRRKENHVGEVRGTGEAIISYPNSNAFGVWAWCLGDKDRAIEMLDNLKPIIAKSAIQVAESDTISHDVEEYTTHL